MKVISVFLLVISFAMESLAQKRAEGKPDILGVVSYTFRKSFQKDVAATLDTIKGMGITNVEFSNLFGRTAADIKQLLDARGMICTSFGTSYEDATTNTQQVATNAKTLGASFVRVAWIPHENSATFSLSDAKKAVDDFNRIGKIFNEEFGLSFCYHNHGYEFVAYENGTLFDFIVAKTKPAYVSIELDVLWAFHAGANPAKLLMKYGNRVKLMHVKDLKRGVVGDLSGKTDPNNDVVLGTGQIDLKAILKAAKNSAIQFCYIEDESVLATKQVPLSIAYLKKIALP